MPSISFVVLSRAVEGRMIRRGWVRLTGYGFSRKTGLFTLERGVFLLEWDRLHAWSSAAAIASSRRLKVMITFPVLWIRQLKSRLNCHFSAALRLLYILEMMEIVLTRLCVTIWRRTYDEEWDSEWDSVKGICLLLQAIDAVGHLCEPFFFSRKLLNNWNRGEIRDCSISILRVMWSFWKQHRRRCGDIRENSIFVCNNTCWWQVYWV